jgi:hypothetical protein
MQLHPAVEMAEQEQHQLFQDQVLRMLVVAVGVVTLEME